ncbi:MAG: hypothetical protein VW397_05045 [Candidatus Margulisiibacteriota bacterium]
MVIFLQYRDLIHVHELDEIMYHYGHTPFHTNVKQLTEFMKRHNIVQIRLLQQSNEMLGVMAIYALGKRTEILKSDAQLFHGLSDAISTAICNATSVNQFFTHQAMLEKVNTSISKFNVNDSLSDVVQLSRRTLLNIMPEIKFYIFLNYDPTSDFYKCGSSFNIHVDGLNFKLHSNFVRGHLKENVSCKFSINAPETPAELNAMMTLIDVKHALFIRVNDSDDSSIIILFFEKMIDLLDYRIPYCQVFLRHFEVFCDYQSNHDQVLRLRAFLQRLLDQLPTGVMIVNDKFKIDYLNSRMTTQLNDHNHQLLNQSIHDSDIHPMIINAVNYAQSNRSEFVQKIQIDQNGQQELHSLSAFSISQPHDFSTIIVLTNIQQSKELIDQMNQTNRLVMMSKIAKGISYELITPVQQLIDGVTRLNDCWQDPKFQDHFVTAVVPQVDRINLLCQSLLRLSRSNTESLVEIYLPDLLDQVLRLIAGDLRYSKHTFYVVHLDREKIVIDQVMAIQVLINLMIFSINSLAKDDSRLSLEIRTREPDKLFVKVGVQNYQNLGQLSDADLKDQLELSIVNQIVINQNGKFNVYSEQTIIYFEVILPIKYLDHVTPPIKSLTH